MVETLVAPTPLSAASINAESGRLFALMLDRGLVDDVAESFAHFHAGGWAAIGPAIAASNDIATFLEPGHVHGMVAELVTDPDARGKVGDKVVTNLDAYLPDDSHVANDNALRAAADYVHRHNVALPADTVVRIANTANNSPAEQHVVLRLLCDADPAATDQHVLDTFAALGHPYSQISDKEKFDIPKDVAGVNKRLLDKLDSNRYRVRQRNKQDYWVVTVV